MKNFEQESRVFEEHRKTGESESIGEADLEKIYKELIALPIIGPSIKQRFEIAAAEQGKVYDK